jgi:hypothetical protein
MEEPTITKSEKSAAGPEFNKENFYCFFFDVKGIVLYEFVPPNTEVNFEFHCDVLRRFRENVRRKDRNIGVHNWLLHHDNAPAPTSVKTADSVTNNNMIIVPHPPYFSTDLPHPMISLCFPN